LHLARQTALWRDQVFGIRSVTMKLDFGKPFVSVAALCGASFLVLSPAQANVQAGKDVPDFTAVDSNGKSHQLSSFKGKTVVLEWSNDGCPYVQKHYGSGNMQALQQEATAAGVVWLTVVSSAPGTQGHVTGAAANKLTTERKAQPSAVLLDPTGKIGKLYDAKTTPHMFVIDGKGLLAYSGAIDDKPTVNQADIKTARNYVKEALSAVASGKPAAVTSTRAYGCSVKYN
jgi:peroxiredoxin